MSKWIAEFDLEDGDTMPEHMDLNYMGAKIDFYCRPMWIPVSERLPDECDYRSCYEVEDGAVLWTNEDGLVGMGYYYESTKTWSDIEDNPIAVIAWMPLPKPYLPDTNDGNMSENPTGSDGVELHEDDWDKLDDIEQSEISRTESEEKI